MTIIASGSFCPPGETRLHLRFLKIVFYFCYFFIKWCVCLLFSLLLQVAAIVNNSDFRLGIRKNAKISTGKNSLGNNSCTLSSIKLLTIITDWRYRVCSNEKGFQVFHLEGESRSTEKQLLFIVLYEKELFEWKLRSFKELPILIQKMNPNFVFSCCGNPLKLAHVKLSSCAVLLGMEDSSRFIKRFLILSKSIATRLTRRSAKLWQTERSKAPWWTFMYCPLTSICLRTLDLGSSVFTTTRPVMEWSLLVIPWSSRSVLQSI